MTDINWQQIAEQNGLSIDEFKKEIFTVAACMGVMDLDSRDADENEAMRFTCSDEVGKIEVYIKRVAK